MNTGTTPLTRIQPQPQAPANGIELVTIKPGAAAADNNDPAAESSVAKTPTTANVSRQQNNQSTLKSAFLKPALAAVSAALALNAITQPDSPGRGLISQNRPGTWLSAGQVEQTDGSITVIKDLSGQREPRPARPSRGDAGRQSLR